MKIDLDKDLELGLKIFFDGKIRYLFYIAIINIIIISITTFIIVWFGSMDILSSHYSGLVCGSFLIGLILFIAVEFIYGDARVSTHRKIGTRPTVLVPVPDLHNEIRAILGDDKVKKPSTIETKAAPKESEEKIAPEPFIPKITKLPTIEDLVSQNAKSKK